MARCDLRAMRAMDVEATEPDQIQMNPWLYRW